jgi:hypothetical protein
MKKRKDDGLEPFMEECGRKLDDLGHKLRFIGAALLADERANFIDSDEVRGVGLVLVEICQGMEVIAILLNDSVPREKYIARMQEANDPNLAGEEGEA